MNLNIGQILSTTFAMLKERFWLILGQWAVFLGLFIILFIGFAVMLGGSMVGMAAFGTAELDNPAALGGLGAGVILSIIVFYIAFILLSIAQQAAMTAVASPTGRIDFGEGIKRGLKTSLSFLGILVLFIIVYVIVSLIAGLLIAALSLLGTAGSIIGALLLIPAAIYFSCRFATILAVVAVERVFNPIAAINRAWSQTQGRVLGIFIVLLISGLVALVLLAIPFLMIGASGAALAGGDPAALEGAGPMVGLAMLLLFPLFLLYQIFSVTLSACLHAEISDEHTEALSDVFE